MGELRMDCLAAFINNHKLGQICQTRRDTVSMESRLRAAQIKVYHNISSIMLSDERCRRHLMTICRYTADDNRPADLLWPRRRWWAPALRKQTAGNNAAASPSEHIREISVIWQKGNIHHDCLVMLTLICLVAHYSNTMKTKLKFHAAMWFLKCCKHCYAMCLLLGV